MIEGETRRVAEPYYALGFLRNLRSAPAPSGDVIPITFRAEGSSEPGLRVSLIPEPNSRIITGEPCVGCLDPRPASDGAFAHEPSVETAGARP